MNIDITVQCIGTKQQPIKRHSFMTSCDMNSHTKLRISVTYEIGTSKEQADDTEFKKTCMILLYKKY